MTPPAADNVYAKGFYAVLDILGGLHEGDEDKVWVRIVDKLAVLLDAEAASYYVVGPKGRQLYARYALGAAPEKLNQVSIEVGQGVCGWVAAHSEPALVPEAYKDPRFLPEVDRKSGFATRSILCAPIFDRLELDGVVELLNKRGGPFPLADLEFVQAVSRMASMSLRALRMEAALHKVTAYNASILENLTGGFLAIDLHGRVMICNPAAKRILEIHEDILNSPIDRALTRSPQVGEILMNTLSTRQTVKRQELAWNFDGKPRTLGYSTLLIQDPRGNLTGAGITFQDLTGLKH